MSEKKRRKLLIFFTTVIALSMTVSLILPYLQF